MKTIHTNLYTEAASNELQSLILDICNQSTQLRHRCHAFKVDQQPNGEIVLEYDGYDHRHLTLKYSESDAKIWLARTIKWLTTKNGEVDWSRTNNEPNPINSNLTIAETYLIYDTLIGRKNLESKYSADLYAKIHGTEKDALATELEAARREEINRIKAKWEPQLYDLDPDSWYSKVHKDIFAKAQAAAEAASAAVKADLMPKALAAFNEAKRQYKAEIDAANQMAAFAQTTDAFPFA